MATDNLSIKHVRQYCLECSGGSAKEVTWCRLTTCTFWKFRHGIQPATFRRRYGDRLLDPAKMPPPGIDIEALPSNLRKAATGAIDVDSYSQPAMEVVPKSKYTDEQRRVIGERLRVAREMAV